MVRPAGGLVRGELGELERRQRLAVLGRALAALDPLRARLRAEAAVAGGVDVGLRPEAKTMLGWPKRCKLALHAFLWENMYTSTAIKG